MRALCSVLFVATLFFCARPVNATILVAVSDLISTSAPSTQATHVLTFTTWTAIPASGKISITPTSGQFSIPVGFDYQDIDFAVATSSTFEERTLAATPSATEEGVSVTTGSSGSILITLNSTEGIAAGHKVRIKMGANATFQTAGSENITNPASVGSHRIYLETRNASNATLDSISVIDAIVSPVSVSGIPIEVTPVISNALPSGTVAAGNTTIELSLQTDIISTCRYSLTPGVSYASMTNTFSPEKARLFTKVLSGFVNGTTYTYYIKCISTQGIVTSGDYILTFSLAPTPSSDVSVTEGDPTGPGGYLGRGGVGEFPNGVNSLYQATVAFSGWAIPESSVVILKDGVVALSTRARADGTFSGSVNELERGTYSFQLYQTDSRGRRSASYTATMTLGPGTVNTLSNVVLPPTIAIAPKTIQQGQEPEALGESVLGKIDLLAVRQAASSSLSAPLFYSGSTTAAGRWSMVLPGEQFSNGTYLFKARVQTPQDYVSPYSKVEILGVGESVSACGASTDINGDGKVNLIDFSILLTMWNTSSGRADFNCDKIVNLADFSILLFNWTG